jgi:hypothetical protein
LRRRGLDVVYLGRNVPLADLEVTLERTQPALLISAAQRLVTAGQLRQMAILLQRQGIVTYYGGQIFNRLPRLRQMLPAHFLGERFEQMTHVIEAALTHPMPPPAVKPLPAAYQKALNHFHHNAPIIEAQVQRRLADESETAEQLAEALTGELSDSIEAALILGDIRLVEHQLGWLAGGAQAERHNLEQLEHLIQAYQQAAEQQLDERGQPVIEWLAEVRIDA